MSKAYGDTFLLFFVSILADPDDAEEDAAS